MDSIRDINQAVLRTAKLQKQIDTATAKGDSATMAEIQAKFNRVFNKHNQENYIWVKLLTGYKRNVAEWFCYLDSVNTRLFLDSEEFEY